VIDALDHEIDAARRTRERLRGRPIRATVAALVAAAARWARDRALIEALPGEAGLSPEMVRTILPLVAGAVDAGTLESLHAREGNRDGPELVAHVLASNVPALAVPAIVLGVLAGAAVLVKSGRRDTGSAPAFRRAIAAVDPELAATVVTAHWEGGRADVEERLLGRADPIVASGGDPTMASLRARFGARVVAHGDRVSLAIVGGAFSTADARHLALDVALYEQRGCLSPHAVLVADGDADDVAARLGDALDTLAARLPPPALDVAERARHGVVLGDAEWSGARVAPRAGGTVVVDPMARVGAGPGRRTVRVHPLASVAAAYDAIAPGRVECVGVAGVALDADRLRRLGVARVCPLGRMQRPRIDWPRGQQAALGSLFRAGGEPRIQVET